MRRLVFCFDGSWNRIDAPFPTNVLFTAESVLPDADGVAQLIFYDEGVGTEEGERVRGGLFGAGLVKNLGDAYRFLIFNHVPDDQIFIFGFSRGAFTARSFAGLLSNCGILRRRDAGRVNEAIDRYRGRTDSDESREALSHFRSECSPHLCVSSDEDEWRAANLKGYERGRLPLLAIQYLGVWDTVGALGVPGYLAVAGRLNQEHQFHDTSLSAFVKHARHAVAIDERRRDFEPTLWDNLDQLNTARNADASDEDAPYQQKWFPGVHGAVGGGGNLRGLSDQALDWIWDGARNAGLVLDSSLSSKVYELAPDHTSALQNSSAEQGFNPISLGMKIVLRKRDRQGPKLLRDVSISAQRRWHEPAARLPEGSRYRPGTLQAVEADLDALDAHELGVGVDDAAGMKPAAFKVHAIKPGDTLRGLAKEYFGSPDLSDRILEANKYKITNPDRIYAGQTLRIPIQQD